MTHAMLLSSDRSRFDAVKNLVGSSIHLDTRFPSWPFRVPYGYATFFDYTFLRGGAFGDVLRELTISYKDALVGFLALEPGEGHYLDYYGFLPGFQTDASVIHSAYAQALTFESAGDAAGISGILGYTVDVLGIAGSSGLWAVFGQIDWEIGVLLTPDRSGPWLDVGVPWVVGDEARELIGPPVGWGEPLDENEVVSFWQHVVERGSGLKGNL